MSPTYQDEFLALLGPVHARLWRFVLSATRDEWEAEDLMSETVLVAFERFHTLRDPKAFISFLFTIATRIHRQHYRRTNRTERLTGDHAQTIATNDALPDRAADIRIVRDALVRLPEKQRETVILFEVSGFSLEEIREIQGGTLSGVKSRLRRGRALLAHLLGVEEMDSSTEITHLKRERTADRTPLPIFVMSHE
jgi:RNA polymerase sigma-70 factor (ECF subfamily)